MDQGQRNPHPFSRNTAPSYGRAPFPPSSNQAPFTPTSHPQNATPAYSEHQRRPSDPPYYNPPRNYGQDGPPISGQGHSRHQSASSIGHGTPVNRGMPPPSSPQQTQQQHPGYGPPRAPPLNVGPQNTFSAGRELPSLGGPRGGMSISDILGGSPSTREPAGHYGSPVTTSGPSTSIFGPSHASPRIQSTGPDYAPFRRPQTPEHQRAYGPRDHRANSAGSPPGLSHYSTPEARQFGSSYRGPAEERREPVRVPNPNAIPPRPNSQPTSFNPSPHRPIDSRPPPNDGRRVDNSGQPPEPGRPEQGYSRPLYEERHDPRYAYGERERVDREAAQQRSLHREREQRELREQREQRDRAEQERHQEYAHQLAQRNAQAYSRASERETPAWMRTGYPESRPHEQNSERPPPQQQSNSYEYPGSSGPSYGGHPAYASNETRNDPRYTQGTQTSSHNPPTSQYEPSSQERYQRLVQMTLQHQQQSGYDAQRPSGYPPQESPVRRPTEESQQMQQQRSFLGVQEINRKGRASPLPQAVQGAQGQMNGPGGEASIKNEFGRMFSGIGSGVGSAMGVSSPGTGGSQSLPFPPSSQLKRDDGEGPQDSPTDNGHKIPRTASRSRKKKLKEEDSNREDEGSTGRRTPSGRGKKRTHHHHHNHHHHYQQRTDPQENTSSPNLTPFKNSKGSAVASPPGGEKDIPNLHHHHVAVPRSHNHTVSVPKPSAQAIPQLRLRTLTVNSAAVLTEISNLPTFHLGYGYYESILKPSSGNSRRGVKRDSQGYSSTPQPLPRFENTQLNCTYTVRVPRVHFSHTLLKETTRRKALWGTDIYTDDSDVVAACIHQGWFRGAWDDSIDVSLLGLDLPGHSDSNEKNSPGDLVLSSPPPTGPKDVPKDHDVHIDIIVLPTLEEYAGSIRFGIKSREWGTKREGHKSSHDGLSFMIKSVKFVSGVDGHVGRGGKERKKIMTERLRNDEVEEENVWNDLFNSQNGIGNGTRFTESFERGGPGPLAREIKAIGTGSWWAAKTQTPSGKGKDKEVQKDAPTPIVPPVRTPPREIRHYAPLDPPIPSPISVVDPQSDIERVTELMVENANSSAERVPSEPGPQDSPSHGRGGSLSARRGSEREIILAQNGIGGSFDVKREAIAENPLSIISDAIASHEAQAHGPNERQGP